MHNNAKHFQYKRRAPAHMPTQFYIQMYVHTYAHVCVLSVVAYAFTCAPSDPARHLVQHRYADCCVLSVFDMSFIIRCAHTHTHMHM